jgi:hypothetical protein
MSDKKKTKPKEEEDILRNMVYLFGERNKAIEEIEKVQKAGSPEMKKWEEDLGFNKEQMLLEKKKILNSHVNWSDYLRQHEKRKSGDKRQKRQRGECLYKEYKNIVRKLERKIHPDRAMFINERFVKNIERCIESLEENLSEDVRRIKSIEASEQELLRLSEDELKALEKAKSRRKEMGNTLESFISYLELLKKRSDYEKFEDSLKFYLSDFDTNQCCIMQIEKFLDGTDDDLGKLSDVVEDNYRPNSMSASFDASTQMVTLYLNNFDRHVIDLSHYLHHLKEGPRKSDIERLEKHIGEISSTRTGWIAHLRCLDPKVKENLPKIRDAVKLDWRASFDVSTQMVCLTNPDEKVGHLSIPEYLEYLNDKLCDYEEILSEKKRACGLLCFYTKECSICFDSDRTEKWSILNCGHKFHTSCISKWKSSEMCPTCRTKICSIIQS